MEIGHVKVVRPDAFKFADRTALIHRTFFGVVDNDGCGAASVPCRNGSIFGHKDEHCRTAAKLEIGSTVEGYARRSRRCCPAHGWRNGDNQSLLGTGAVVDSRYAGSVI